jgi:hypothetical protein
VTPRTFLVLTFLISAAALVVHAQAGISCINYYQGNVPVPAGYGAAYDVNNPSVLLLKAVCDQGTPRLEIGDGNQSRYIYDQGYFYANGQWNVWQFSSANALAGGAWYPGSAYVNFGPSTVYTNWEYNVAYICTWTGSKWNCGCADAACTTGYWQLQAWESSAVASGGGTSNGGSNGSGAGGQWGGTPDANAIVISPNGNDANPCTVNSPCQSLERAQQAVRSSSDKTVYLREGTYNRSSTLTLSGGDSGETWMTYPGDAVDSAVLDGGGTLSGGVINTSNATDITINGLKIQNYYDVGILNITGGNNLTIENCDIGSSTFTGAAAATPISAISVGGSNTVVKNNYIHDVAGNGISLFAYGAGDTLDGSIISGNVVLRSCQYLFDEGALYTNMMNTGNTGGHVTITDNFVRDYGSSSNQKEVHGIYLDDFSSNVTITGNVIGPPTAGTVNAGSDNTSALLFHNGDNITASGNIFDVGDSSYATVVVWGRDSGSTMSNTNISGNIVLANFSGNQNANILGVQNGASYYQNVDTPSAWYTIANNVYHNYGGGQERSDGVVVGDTNPIHADPQISGYLYTISSGSPVFSQINFQPIKGGWGPPGFVIPTSSNHSDP